MELILQSILIAICRVVDVSFGTMRTIAIVRGNKSLSMLFGLIEVIVWLSASSMVLTNLSTPILGVGYCIGYVIGIYSGMIIDKYFNTAEKIIKIYSSQENIHLFYSLLNRHGVTVCAIPGQIEAKHSMFVLKGKPSILSTIANEVKVADRTAIIEL